MYIESMRRINLKTNFLWVLMAHFILGLTHFAHAQTVVLSGVIGNRAVIVVNNAEPKTVAIGQIHQGIKVIDVRGNSAILEWSGQKQRTLYVGEEPVQIGSQIARTSNGRQIILFADPSGHFVSSGSFNGQNLKFMVDTGATVVTFSKAQADQIGLDYQNAKTVQVSTANGIAQAWSIKLRSIRIGDVEMFNIDAVVIPQPMPYVLLGNSYLTQFQMQRSNNKMTLEK